MKNKYLFCGLALGIFLALNGCGENENPQEGTTYSQDFQNSDHSQSGKNENPQEDTAYNQNLQDDDHVEESSESSENKSETDNKILDHSSHPADDHNQDNPDEHSDGWDNPDGYSGEQNNLDEPSNIPDSPDKNAYFLPTDNEFYKEAACNPIDRKYVIDAEAAPLEIWQSALEKCEAWNQQTDFTGSKLADYDQLQNAISLWHDYYQEEVYQNRELYGNNGMIPGSMYTAVSADVLTEKCRFTSLILLSQEYELSGNVSFAEKTEAAGSDSEYSLSPQSFCIEYTSGFEEALIPYSLDEKNSDELEKLIRETANKIEEKFGHDFTEHTDKYVSFIHALYTIENDLSEDGNRCLVLKENRLKLYVTELLNLEYMLDA